VSKITELATGEITITEMITIELVEADGKPAAVIITWPARSTVVHPAALPIGRRECGPSFRRNCYPRLAQIRRGPKTLRGTNGRGADAGTVRPIGPWSLYCNQGARAYVADAAIHACPYGSDREFSGRAWRDGWRAAASVAGVKMPHECGDV
jgi:hypothetical protein